MAYKTGANVTIAHGTGATFGTADAVGAGDKLVVDSLAHDRSPEELTETGIGSGAEMAADSQQGATTPRISITKTAYYNDAGLQAVANFFQGESVTGGSLGYSHSFMHGGYNQKYLTVAATYAANSVMESASGAVTSLSHTFDNPPNYSKLTYDILCNDILYTGTTNSFATVEGTTVSNQQKVFAKPADTVTIGIGGASSVIAVTNITYSLSKEQASAREMRNATGNGAPIPTGDPPFGGTVSITLKSWDDHTYFTGAIADTTYWLKSKHLSADFISGATNKYTWEWRFPALKLITEPDSDINTGGVNPLTLNFKCIYAQSIPTGMYSKYPHLEVINDKATAYFA